MSSLNELSGTAVTATAGNPTPSTTTTSPSLNPGRQDLLAASTGKVAEEAGPEGSGNTNTLLSPYCSTRAFYVIFVLQHGEIPYRCL